MRQAGWGVIAWARHSWDWVWPPTGLNEPPVMNGSVKSTVSLDLQTGAGDSAG